MSSTEPDYKVHCADAVEWLKGLGDSSVDLIVTDPPYESLEKHRAKGTTTRLKNSKASSNRWFDIFGNQRFPEFFAESYRVLAPNRHMYVMCDSETMFVIKPMVEEAGFRFWKPIVWDKVAIGMGYHYRARCEFILFFEKGKRKLNDLSVPDVLAHKRIRSGYPTEKPVELLETLIRQSTAPGEVVVDPFMGSGTSGVASLKQQRRFLGSDTCEEAIRVAVSRLAATPPAREACRR